MKTQQHNNIDYMVAAFCYILSLVIMFLLLNSSFNTEKLFSFFAFIGIAYLLYRPYEYYIKPNLNKGD